MKKRRSTAEVLLSRVPKRSKRPSWMALESPPISPDGMSDKEAHLWWVSVRVKPQRAKSGRPAGHREGLRVADESAAVGTARRASNRTVGARRQTFRLLARPGTDLAATDHPSGQTCLPCSGPNTLEAQPMKPKKPIGTHVGLSRIRLIGRNSGLRRCELGGRRNRSSEGWPFIIGSSDRRISHLFKSIESLHKMRVDHT